MNIFRNFISRITFGLVLVSFMQLTACGGSSSNSHSKSMPISIPTKNCSDAPIIKTGTTYFGTTTSGQVGRWYFDTAGLSVLYNFPDSHGDAKLKADPTTCNFTITSANGLYLGFLENGLAVGAVTEGATVSPVMLISEPEMSLSEIAGTYSVIRRMTIGSTIIIGGGAFNIDRSGSWEFCPISEYSTSCPALLTGILVAESDGIFDIVMDIMGLQVHGKLIAKVSGTSKLITVAINNQFNVPAITGMWLGSNENTLGSNTVSENYITNMTGGTTDIFSFLGLAGSVKNSTFNIVLDMQQKGIASLVGSELNGQGFLSSLGIFAFINPTGDGGGNLSIGIKNIK